MARRRRRLRGPDPALLSVRSHILQTKTPYLIRYGGLVFLVNYLRVALSFAL